LQSEHEARLPIITLERRQNYARDGSMSTIGINNNNNKQSAIYDPRSNSWSHAAPCLRNRAEATFTKLQNGEILAVGGKNIEGATRTVEIY